MKYPIPEEISNAPCRDSPKTTRASTKKCDGIVASDSLAKTAKKTTSKTKAIMKTASTAKSNKKNGPSNLRNVVDTLFVSGTETSLFNRK